MADPVPTKPKVPQRKTSGRSTTSRFSIKEKRESYLREKKKEGGENGGSPRKKDGSGDKALSRELSRHLTADAFVDPLNGPYQGAEMDADQPSPYQKFREGSDKHIMTCSPREARAILDAVQTYSPCWNRFTQVQIKALAEHMTIRSYAKDEFVFEKGDAQSFVGVLLQGSLDVVLGPREVAEARNDERWHKYVVAKLTAGEVIGEMAIFYPQGTRTATLVSREECLMATLSIRLVSDINKSDPALGLALLRVFCQAAIIKLRRPQLPRCVAHEQQSNVSTPAGQEAFARWLASAHRDQNGLGSLTDNSEIDTLVKFMSVMKFDKHMIILRQGERSTYAVFILDGEVSIERFEGQRSVELARRKAGWWVGEDSFLEGFAGVPTIRNANCVAASKRVVLATMSLAQLYALHGHAPELAMRLTQHICRQTITRLMNTLNKKVLTDHSEAAAQEDPEDEDDLDLMFAASPPGPAAPGPALAPDPALDDPEADALLESQGYKKNQNLLHHLKRIESLKKDRPLEDPKPAGPDPAGPPASAAPPELFKAAEVAVQPPANMMRRASLDMKRQSRAVVVQKKLTGEGLEAHEEEEEGRAADDVTGILAEYRLELLQKQLTLKEANLKAKEEELDKEKKRGEEERRRHASEMMEVQRQLREARERAASLAAIQTRRATTTGKGEGPDKGGRGSPKRSPPSRKSSPEVRPRPPPEDPPLPPPPPAPAPAPAPVPQPVDQSLHELVLAAGARLWEIQQLFGKLWAAKGGGRVAPPADDPIAGIVQYCEEHGFRPALLERTWSRGGIFADGPVFHNAGSLSDRSRPATVNPTTIPTSLDRSSHQGLHKDFNAAAWFRHSSPASPMSSPRGEGASGRGAAEKDAPDKDRPPPQVAGRMWTDGESGRVMPKGERLVDFGASIPRLKLERWEPADTADRPLTVPNRLSGTQIEYDYDESEISRLRQLRGGMIRKKTNIYNPGRVYGSTPDLDHEDSTALGIPTTMKLASGAGVGRPVNANHTGPKGFKDLKAPNLRPNFNRTSMMKRVPIPVNSKTAGKVSQVTSTVARKSFLTNAITRKMVFTGAENSSYINWMLGHEELPDVDAYDPGEAHNEAPSYAKQPRGYQNRV